MKIVRLVQLLCVAALGGYLVWLHFSNQDVLVKFPLFIPLSASLALLIAFIFGFFISWVPSRIRRYRMNREINRLERRSADLERTLGIPSPSNKAVIPPDRDPELSHKARQG